MMKALLVVLSGLCLQAAAFVPLHHFQHSHLNPTCTTTSKNNGLPFSSTTTTTTKRLTDLTTRSPSSSTQLQALPAVIIPAAIAAIPLSQKIFLSCLLPTCLGYYRSEYGVSYAYGLATAKTSFWMWQALILASKKSNPLASWQAGALMFYGIRLCLFLAYREIFTEHTKNSVQRIEAKAKGRGPRWKRTPFILSCAGLYFGLCAPLLITSQVNLAAIPRWAGTLMKGLVASTWVGFLLGALGDLQKSWVKARKGEDHLVTGGIYGLVRHPNYSGELVGWTSNGLLAIVATIASRGAVGGLSMWQLGAYLAASVMGSLGLDFVLLGATDALEKRQKEKYGESKNYQEWIDSTWTGFELPAKVEEAVEEVIDPAVTPEIEVVDTDEAGGTGI